MKPQISSRDLKSLSLYLDGQLNPAERQRLEKRLQTDQVLRLTLAEMRQTRGLLRSMPRVHSPCNFTLTPQMIGSQTPRPAYPVLGFVSALAGFLFVIVLVGDLLGIFTRSASSVALRQVSNLEAAAPAQEKSVLAAPTQTIPPTEIQAVQGQEALSTSVVAADESAVQITQTAPPAPAGLVPGVEDTATPRLEGMYAKEAPSPALGGSEDVSASSVITATEVLEMELPLMTTPTGESMTEAPALAENNKQPAVPTASPTVREEVPQVETGAQDQSQLVEEEKNPSRESASQNGLWILEGIFASIALITGLMFFIQRRRKTS